MTKKQSLVFFGNERLATGVSTTAPTLQLLIDAGYNVSAVVSHNEKSSSRNARDLEIAKVAEKYNIPVLLPNKPSDIIEQLAGFDAEIGVLVAYGKIIPQKIIDIFPKGIINIHPSALPKHRGPTPLESVILSGELTTAVSIMNLTAEMDAGAVYRQRTVEVAQRPLNKITDSSGQSFAAKTDSGSVRSTDGTPPSPKPVLASKSPNHLEPVILSRNHNITKQELADQLLAIGGELLLEVIAEILNGTSKPPIEQEHSLATFDKLIQKQDGLIDWSKSATQIEREIRAYANWPKSTVELGGIPCVITKVTITSESGAPGQISTDDKHLTVYCGESSLIIERIKPAGKNEMDAEAFLAGYAARMKSDERRA